MRSVRPTRKIIFYLLLCFLVFACALLLSEAILRLSGHVTIQGVHTVSEQDFNRIPGAFEPRQDVIERPRPELAHHVSINPLGFRGSEISRTKPPGTVRILCIGDSVTYGSYVNDEETIPFYLEKAFVQKQIPVEVINGGVGGTTIVDQLYFLKRSMKIDPDIVILTFSENDIDDLGKTQPMYISLANNRRIKSNPLIGPLYRLIRDTALFNFGLLLKAKYAEQFTIQGIHAKKSGVAQATQGGRESLWRRYGDHLKEMQIYLDDRSVHFVFAIFPSHFWIGRKSPYHVGLPDRLARIEKLAQKNGVSTLNLLPALEKSNLPANELYLLPYDGHPSRVAYSIVGNSMFGYLQDAVRDIRVMKAAMNGKNY